MNTLLRITLIIVSSFAIIYSPFDVKAQCKVDVSDPVKGEFSINGPKVQVNGDGGGMVTAANNIPIRICEGELITLKNTLQISSQVSTSYWITPITIYNASSSQTPSNPSLAGNYSTLTGSIEVKIIDKLSDPRGLSFYDGPGRYVITQYDNSTSSSGAGFHHACQVIEVIKPTVPVATAKSCTFGEYEIEFLKHPNNLYHDYEITFNAFTGNYNPILKTGKPTGYPFSIKSGTILPDDQDRIITIKGLSVTGGCIAPISNLGRVAVNNTSKPTVKGILATNQTNDFKLITNAKNSFNVNVFVRESQKEVEYDYNRILKTFKSKGILQNDTVLVNVPDGKKQYCFQVESIDLICPTNIGKPYLKSTEEVCTTPIKVEVLKNKNVLTWAKAPTSKLAGVFKYYEISRFKSKGSNENRIFQISNIDSLKINDTTVSCNNNFTYQVFTYNGQQSYSEPVRVTSDGDFPPPAISQIFVTTTNDNKKLYVQGVFDLQNIPDDVKPNSFKFYRSDFLQGKYLLTKTGNSVFIDSTSENNIKSSCYYLTWTNYCDNESLPSKSVCSVFLKKNNGILEWTKENSHSVSTDSYIVQEVDSKGFNIQELGIVAPNSNLFNLQNLVLDYGEEKFFQIEARPQGWNVINSNSLPSSLSNVIRIFRAPLLANEQEETVLVKIYPNPSQEVLSIELKNEKPEIVNWILQNQTGQLINQSISDKQILNYQAQIDIKRLSKGMYFLKIQSGEKVLIRKIIKD